MSLPSPQLFRASAQLEPGQLLGRTHRPRPEIDAHARLAPPSALRRPARVSPIVPSRPPHRRQPGSLPLDGHAAHDRVSPPDRAGHLPDSRRAGRVRRQESDGRVAVPELALRVRHLRQPRLTRWLTLWLAGGCENWTERRRSKPPRHTTPRLPPWTRFSANTSMGRSSYLLESRDCFC